MDDDDNMGDIFRSFTKLKQEKRASNRQQSADTLKSLGIPFADPNAGAHLIIRITPSATADFWPGTGLWKIRNKGNGRGIRSLIKAINRIAGSNYVIDHQTS